MSDVVAELEHLSLEEQQIAQLKQYLPEIFSEGKIDFEKFKQHFSNERFSHLDSNTPPPERYGLNWAGKSNAYKVLQQASRQTLSPCIEQSLSFDTTQNLFIEGENLEVLKILQKSYFNAVKMIYIDPPYNTGKDFIYKDNFSESKEAYAKKVGDLNDSGEVQRAWVKNSKENGHFHSNWLNMMLPRLYLARNLLRDDGVIFISIDDNEQAQLKLLCDEVFGEENFVGDFIWITKNAARGVPPTNMLMSNHEYIVCYAKIGDLQKFKGIERSEDDFSNPDNDPRGLWRSESMKATGKQNNFFTIKDPTTGNEFYNNWAFSENKVKKMLEEGLVLFPKTSDGTPRQKKFINSYTNDKKAFVSYLGWFSTENSAKNLMNIFNNQKLFDFPKPVDLIKFLVTQSTNSNSIILDFFAGSGTTAHAVMQLNTEDGANRRFICVQLPEETSENSKAYQAGYSTIAEITKERIRRAGKQIAERYPDQTMDTGFKVFKLTDSHFKQWHSPVSDEELSQQLEAFIDPIVEGTSPEDLCYELLLRLGLKLTTQLKEDEHHIYYAKTDRDQTFALLLKQAITDETLAHLVKQDIQKVVVLDRLFQGNDALKKNMALTLSDLNIAFLVI